MSSQDNNSNNNIGKVLLWGGGVTMAIGIPQWIIGSGKSMHYKAIQEKNEASVNLSLGMTASGLGMVLNF